MTLYIVKSEFSGHSKRRPTFGFQDRFTRNAGQKYCRMLQGEHSAILSTFIKLSFVIKIFVLSIFEWPLKTGFTVFCLKVHVQEVFDHNGSSTKAEDCNISRINQRGSARGKSQQVCHELTSGKI